MSEATSPSSPRHVGRRAYGEAASWSKHAAQYVCPHFSILGTLGEGAMRKNSQHSEQVSEQWQAQEAIVSQRALKLIHALLACAHTLAKAWIPR